VVLASLIYFLALVLFSSQTRIFGLIYGRTKDFGSTQSSQPSRIKSIESKKSESKGLYSVWFKDVFDKQLLGLFLLVLLQKMDFYQTKPKN